MSRADRQHTSVVISDIHRWIHTARETRKLERHPAVTGPTSEVSDLPELDSLRKIRRSGDLDLALFATKRLLFPGRAKYKPAFEAAGRLTEFHTEFQRTGHASRLENALDKLHERAQTERARLRSVLGDLDDLARRAATTLEDATHMPVTRAGVLTADEISAIRTLTDLVEAHDSSARKLLNQAFCDDGRACKQSHASARILLDLGHPKGFPERRVIEAAIKRVTKQFQAEQSQVRKLADQVATWDSRADASLGARARAEHLAQKRVEAFMSRSVEVSLSTRVTLVGLTPEDKALLPHLALLRDFNLTPEDKRALDEGLAMAGGLKRELKRVFDRHWNCQRNASCVSFHDKAATHLKKAAAMEDALTRLRVPAPNSSLGLDRITEPSLGLRAYFPGNPSLELVDAALTERARKGLAAITDAAKTAQAAAETAKTAAHEVRAGDIVRMLREMDLEVLRKAAPSERIRVTPLANAGLRNVWDVVERAGSSGLSGLPGLGEASAIALQQAAHQLFDVVREETPVRIDVKRRGADTRALLEALRTWHAVRQFSPTKHESALARGLTQVLRQRRTSHVLGLHAADSPPQVVFALNDALRRSTPDVPSGDIWTDFLSRPADYFGMLTELGFVTEDEQNMHGDLPEAIIKAVRDLELKRDDLTASLRAYQSFGARFALVQRKVVIGDEMGLGKTIEALAALAHLRTTGHTHFLVVCPAAVVSNWMRETARHTKLTPHRLHGPMWERTHAGRSWQRNGGVAVTTYDLLAWVEEEFGRVNTTGVVFDEAHYIKNPQAKRSRASTALIERVPYVILMTGTPLENKVQEFRNLVGYIRPDLSENAPDYLASRFRKHVAPAYLRRNQEDVLTELPELVEVDEWMGMSKADEAEYRLAVQDSHFMRMRRAAMLSEKSLKMQRLGEIVEEAEANNRRVIVFSYFRDVLDIASKHLPGQVFGPLTGSTPANQRQRLIDRFGAARGGAVLLGQIGAAGTGLNIQSASVVVICEPQLKPTIEAQAVARAHRMGQTTTVQVHRLLSENSVDERIRDILASKRHLFDEFARESVIANRAPDAVDINDAEMARLVVEAERERLLGQQPS